MRFFSAKRYNYITVLFVPDDANPTRAIRVRKTYFMVLAVIVVFVFAFALAQMFVYPYFMRKMWLSSSSRKELMIANAKLASLNEEIENLRQLRERILALLSFSASEKQDFSEVLPLGSVMFEMRSKDEFVPHGIPAQGFITARFGEKAPFFKTPHTGVDIVLPVGSFVRSTASGRISRVYYDPVMGNTVELDHKNGYVTRYCHLQRALVSVGEEVKQGKIIGLSGRSGKVYGAHLHYEVLFNGVAVDPLSEEKVYGGKKAKR